MKLRLRSPLKGLARYAATRMPWLPGQYELRNQISGVWWSLCIIYIPTTIIFCKFYLDHNLKIPSEEKDQWMIRPYGFKTISEQITGNKSRQLLLAGCLFTGVILWLFYLIIFYYSFYFFHFPYWRNGIRDWLYELQRFYFWHFKELTLWVPKNSPKAYHLLDDGKDSFLIIDILQNIFECCGIENGTVDWASDHIERPKPSTYRKSMRISNSFQEAHYLIPNVSNRSLPFSCCKRNKYSFTTDSVPCNNINPINDDVFYNQGCLNPLMSFLTSRWMKDQMICLLIVLLTMIPQIIPMIASVSPGQLNEEFNTTLYSIEKAVIRQTAEIKNIGKAGVSQLRRLTIVCTQPTT
ncbi:unnamed protein product [Heterobilharzia americana]|nr:unnamed protein product [Heterobilharzia americana]